MIVLQDGTKLQFKISSTTAAPDAPRGTIAGKAFTTWYQIDNDLKYYYLSFGCFDENMLDTNKIKTKEDFAVLVNSFSYYK